MKLGDLIGEPPAEGVNWVAYLVVSSLLAFWLGVLVTLAVIL